MIRGSRRLFPLIYASLLLPVAQQQNHVVRIAVLAASPALALLINFRLAVRVITVLAVALLTLIPLLVLVQGAMCQSPGQVAQRSLVECVSLRLLTVVPNVGMLSATLLLAAANEWRSSLLATVNGMYLPRSIRMVAIISGAMVGEFRRAIVRVHQAFTGRGEAAPSVSLGNLLVLPFMLGCVWAAVLSGTVERMRGLWSSEVFWATFVPADPDVRRGTRSDIAVLGVCAVVITSSVWAYFFNG
jgi:hypothetical protein